MKRKVSRVRVAVRWFDPLFAVILAAPLVWSASVSAQEADTASAGGDPGRLCHVYAEDAGEGALKNLGASCQGRGLMLGQVDHFDVVDNVKLSATLVDARRPGGRRILLLAPGDDGEPIVSDMTGQIALAAGRGIMSEINDIAIDFGAFSTTGEVVVSPAKQAEAAMFDRSSKTETGHVSMSEELFLARGRDR
jgi:hypothetical protein